EGTIDELRWKGPTHRIAVAIHRNLLVNALDETAHERSIELIENWNLTDSNVMAVLLAMTADLNSGSPAGRLYGESLANALAVYLLTRYAVRRYIPATYRGGLPGYRLRPRAAFIWATFGNCLRPCELFPMGGGGMCT